MPAQFKGAFTRESFFAQELAHIIAGGFRRGAIF